jgi:hypothetical protein
MRGGRAAHGYPRSRSRRAASRSETLKPEYRENGAEYSINCAHGAAKVLGIVGEIAISGRHVNRLTEEIGTELAADRDRATNDYVHHRRTEPSVPAPPVAAVALDGGRLMTRVGQEKGQEKVSGPFGDAGAKKGPDRLCRKPIETLTTT